MGQPNYRNGFQVTTHEHMLARPFQWKRPQMVFVNSMSDLFHEDVALEFILRAFEVMRQAEWHIFQVLTKRSERLSQVSHLICWPVGQRTVFLQAVGWSEQKKVRPVAEGTNVGSNALLKHSFGPPSPASNSFEG
jgi:protein gp37